MSRKPKNRKKRRKTRIFVKIFYGISILVAALAGYIVYNTFQGLYGDLPNKESLKKIEHAQATEIYTQYGTLMGRYYFENRNSIHFDQIPVEIIQALIATEDVRFFEHHGIDSRSLLRVLFRTILLGDESSGGGSTITQQLAKNLYPRRINSHIGLIGTKLREMIIAWRLEDIYSKKQIIQLYLNTVPFGENTYGIKNAAQLYFNALPPEITLEQACTLIGMLKGTSYYNPHKHPKRASERRNIVISQMAKYGYLKPGRANDLKKEPLGVDYHPVDQNNGMAPYLREHLRPLLKEWCKKHKKPNGEPYNLYTDGLKVYTTIDGHLQQYAEKAIEKHMPGLQKIFNRQINLSNHPDAQKLIKKIISRLPAYQGISLQDKGSSLYKKKTMEVFTWEGPKLVEMSPIDSIKHYLGMLNAGFLAMDPNNGKILAWVGGIDHRFFKYDHVTSKRQLGSTFKPFVYSNALREGAKPCDYYPNDSIVYEDYDQWSPNNANRKYGGVYSLQGALINSVNTISVQILMESGIDSTIQLARKMGLNSDFPKVPSLALGTMQASVLNMAEAYSSFANKGTPQNARAIIRIENSQGKVLEHFHTSKSNKRAVNEKNAEQITMMLENVVKRGTGSSLTRNFEFSGDIAGKTGTTQDHADGWFVGYNPNLVLVSWVGADYPSIHFKSLTYGQGAATALPIAGYFLNELYKKHPNSKYLTNFHYDLINPEKYSCPDYRDEAPGVLEKLLEALKKGQKKRQLEKEKSFIEKIIDKLKGEDEKNK
jgi:penicillin-binding protein 1A